MVPRDPPPSPRSDGWCCRLGVFLLCSSSSISFTLFKYPGVSRNINPTGAQGWTKPKRHSRPTYRYILTPHRSHPLRHGDGLSCSSPGGLRGSPDAMGRVRPTARTL